MRKIIIPQTPDKTVLLPNANIASGIIAFHRASGDFAGLVTYKDRRYFVVDYFGIISSSYDSLEKLINDFNEFKFFEIGKQPQ